MGLIVKGGLTAADLLLDDALGPDTPTGAAGDAAKGINYVLEIMQDVKTVGGRTKAIAKQGGKALTVEGCNGSVEASGQVIGLGSAWMHREWELCARAGAVGRAQASLVTCGEVVGGQSA